MLLLVFHWLLNSQSKYSYSETGFVMIEIINKEEGDVYSLQIMCFHLL